MDHWKRLLELLPPPANPHSFKRTWQTVESELGLSLPADYKQFIDTYGPDASCPQAASAAA